MSPDATELPAPPPIWPMYRAMVGVGLLCGLLIVGVFVSTGPVIARNRAAALERAILEVLPNAEESRSFQLDETGGGFSPVADAAPRTPVVHAGYDAEGRLVGLAIEASGMGYQDVIHVLYGYDFTRQAVVGIRVLESRETPGLGDRIETDPVFLANFERLDVALGPEGAIANPIEFVKPGQKEHDWQVDGITGATISARAIANILAASTARWVPLLRGSERDFRRGEGA